MTRSLAGKETEAQTHDSKVYESWFESLQDHICQRLEKIESDYNPEMSKTFTEKKWNRCEGEIDEGGGRMRVLQDGSVFEKAGVNCSTVYGEFSESFGKEIPGTEESRNFRASGLSIVVHPRNPFVPIIHMNTRFIQTGKLWFGGGADLTPCIQFDEDTNYFHQELKKVCDAYSPTAYADYKKWCDEYFYLPHRKEPRGIGGIFFDYLNSGNVIKDFDYVKAVGEAFINIYEAIVRKRMHMPWGESEKKTQLLKRGRYVEFNLLYDRGTRFGLMTNGNTEAILMSLPPHADWDTVI
ncbi:MAG: oxygen-dependent coproporphyrinogen oxidase [Candidatus Puniceispirillum sp.]|nr:oxygen-dependent coproporphyrinogen oxidase [Candidatus Pelagibacter sp.]MBA4283165.1 oxygen-dependent coproporphyrinogen oxidase [Candidatus Puniceispirillum sp.]